MQTQTTKSIYQWYTQNKKRKTEIEGLVKEGKLTLPPPPPPPTEKKEETETPTPTTDTDKKIHALTERYGLKLSKLHKDQLAELTELLGNKFDSQTIRQLIAWGLALMNGGASTLSPSITIKRKKSTKRATTQEESFLKLSAKFRKDLMKWGQSGNDKKILKELQVQWIEPHYDPKVLDVKALASAKNMGQRDWMDEEESQ